MSSWSASQGVQLVGLDESALSRLRELDPSGQGRLLDRVFAAFESSAGRLMPQLAEARKSGDLSGMRFVAHTLKASSASIGATRLSRLCEQIEAMARQSMDDGLPARLDDMTAEMDQVLEYLRALRPISS